MGAGRAKALAVLLHRVVPNVVAGRAAVLESGDESAVHRLRQALRRVRALLRLIRHEAPSPQLVDLQFEARTLAAALAPVRAWDVFVGETLALARHHGLDPVLADRLGQSGAQARAAALSQARMVLRVPGLGDFTTRLAALEVDAGQAAITDGAASAIVRVMHRRVVRRGRRFRSQDEAARHRVRLAGKALIDVAGLLEPSYRVSHGRLEPLSRLNAAIGAARDRQAALALAQRIAEPRTGAALVAALNRAGKGEQCSLRRRWQAFRQAPAPRVRRKRDIG